jgi:hypothetical protein
MDIPIFARRAKGTGKVSQPLRGSAPTVRGTPNVPDFKDESRKKEGLYNP